VTPRRTKGCRSLTMTLPSEQHKRNSL
jgi:hypothetical protein